MGGIDMPNENIVLNWLVFIGECLLIALAVLLICFVVRWLWALIRRCRAVCKLKKAARDSGYALERRGLRWLSLGKRRAETAFVLSRDGRVYHVHFVPAAGRARTLRFLAHDAYVSEREFGFLLLNTNKPMSLSTARMFKPAGTSGSTLQWTHTETAAFPSGTIRLRGLEQLAENRAQGIQDVILLNPVPMKAFVRNGNSWDAIIGGETVFGVAFHDIGSFCTLLRHN